MVSNSTSTPQLLPTETSSQSSLTAFSLGSCSSSIAHQFSNRDRNLTIVTSSGPNALILNHSNGQLKSVLPFPFHILDKDREAAGNGDGDGGEQQQQVQLVGIGSCQEDNQSLVFSVSSSLIVFYSATFSSTSTSSQSYRLHSTLLLPLSSPILTASLYSSYLLIGTNDFVAIYKSTLDSSRQPTWRQIWKKKTPDRVRKVEFLSREEEGLSSSEKDTITFAALCENDDRVLVFDFNRKISYGPNGKMDQENREGDFASKRKSKSRREIKPKVTNRLIHSREVVDFTWRKSEEKDSPQVLVTHTIDGVAKVWMSVIDEPSILKLWSSMDLSGWGDDSFNSSNRSDLKGKSSINRSSCPSFYLDSKALNHSIKTSLNLLDQELQMMELGIHEISDSSNQSSKNDQEKLLEKKKTRKKRLEHILNDSKDLFLRIMKNDEICIKALVNLDRKPPTLFESFTVLHLKSDSTATIGSIAEEKKDIDSLHLLPLIPNSGGKDNSSTKANAVLSGIKSTSSRTAYGRSSSFQIEMEMGGLFDGDMNALNIKRKEIKSPSFKFDSTSDPESWEHSRSIGTILRDHSGKRVLTISEGSKSSKEKDEIEMVFWEAIGEKEDLSCGLGLAQSRSLRIGSESLGEERIALLPHGLGVAQLTSPTSITVFSKSDPLELPISVSSNDQIVLITSSPSTVGDSACLLSAITSKKEVYVWEIKFFSSTMSPEIKVVNQSTLPQSQDQETPSKYFKVNQSCSPSFGCISSNGSIEIYTLTSSRWNCSSKINTSRENVSLVKANSSGLLAIVSSAGAGSELSIWNSKEADFCSGLEHSECFEEKIEALDWSSHEIENGRPLLAVAFSTKVKIYSPTRLEDRIATQIQKVQGWEVVSEIDVATLTPNKINALNFLPNTQLLIASSNQIMSFGPYLNHSNRERKPLFQLVEDKSGNLRQYHPIMIRECLKWGKIEVAKKILVNLWNSLKHQSFDHQVVGNEKDIQTIEEIEYIQAQEVHHDHFLKEEERRSDASLESKDLFVEGSDDLDDSESFSSSTASKLLQKLKASHLHLRGLALTEQEISHLRSMIQTVSEVDEQRQTLDTNGLRYLASLKAFMISRSNSSEASSSAIQSNLTFGSVNSSSPPKSSSLPRLSSRDTLWAFHSSSQELLTSNLSQSFSNKLTWSAARSTGLFLWIKDISLLKIQAEEVAKAQYMSGEDRDPVSCSLLYYALGKHKLVLGLWKQAAWHPEQKKMLAFLKNDFEEQRWKTASKKNAFALLSQRRFEFAAVFFMLGDALQDAVNVVVRHLEDLDLAIALTRIKQGDDGPVFRDLIKNRVLPKSIEEGDRATSSWAFWKLGRKDLAIQVLMKPFSFMLQERKMSEILPAESFASLLKARTSKASFESTSVYHSDPSLILILAQLKQQAPLAFQSVEGTSAEWDYVLHVNRMLIRMGCPLLGLSLLRNWSFHLPSPQVAEVVDSSSIQAATASLDPASISSTLNSSLVIDGSKNKVSHLGEASSASQNDSSFLDVSSSSIRPFPPGTSTIFESVPPSESGSVILPAKEESVKEKDEEVGAKAVKKTGLGSLMKEAKSSTKQGAQEFSFDSFGF